MSNERESPRRLIPAHAGKTYCQDCQALILPAHPRSRGENTAARGDKIAGAGSSPLTRGKLLLDANAAYQDRLIPAHAGKTRADLMDGQSEEAHPRSRGENDVNSNFAELKAGSSPLTRGKPIFAPGLPIRVRLIPAHAGKTFVLDNLKPGLPAHPRSRGENDQYVRMNGR